MNPIFPIFPSFCDDKLEFYPTEKYIEHIIKGGGKTIMSTAGSSQFNLMNNNEIRLLNQFIINIDSPIEKIIGINYGSSSYVKKEIEWLKDNTTNKNYKIMLLYPERYYNDKTIIEFFYDIADFSENEIWIHGMYMRKGNGGIYDYDSVLINELSNHVNITGMKEETSDIGLAFSTVNNINQDFDVCVAGGSMRRHMFLSTNRDVNFLAGVGSLFPKIEVNYSISDLSKRKNIIKEYENPLFEVFMKIGWHASIRYGLKQLGYINNNRKPFVELSENETKMIDSVMKKIKEKNE